MAATQVEREDKYDVADSFRLPPTYAEVEPETVHLESTYYDTADHDLLRNRITLRRRSGDADTGWQLKLPQRSARLEIRLPEQAGGTDVPERLADIVAGVTSGAPLTVSAVLRTERTRRLVRDGDRVVAEIAQDAVHAAAAGATARITEWHELEVELVDGRAKDLREIGRALRAAGAVRSGSGSKLARALDWSAPPSEPDPDDARELVRGYLAASVAQLLAGDVALRRGFDEVHRTRVATRRIRSVLRVFDPVLDAGPVGDLERELSWYQDQLGVVRDAQVQRARLSEAVTLLPPELVLGPVAADIGEDLRATAERGLVELRRTIGTDRYRELLRAVRTWADDPPLRPGTTPQDLVRLAERARRTSAKRLRQGTRDGGAQLHRARKAAKRSRYAAELLTPALGKRAAKSVKRHKRVQDVLGEFQDSVLASDNLRRLGAGGGRSGRNGFTFGLLYAGETTRRRLLLADAQKLTL